jgi:hypothetical protein
MEKNIWQIKFLRNKPVVEFSPKFFDMLLDGNIPEYVLPADSSKPGMGWKQIAPKLISERRELYANCGPNCFLMPNELKFPICSKQMDCKINCSALNSANVRAGQYKYPDVQRKAADMYYEHCLSK